MRLAGRVRLTAERAAGAGKARRPASQAEDPESAGDLAEASVSGWIFSNEPTTRLVARVCGADDGLRELRVGTDSRASPGCAARLPPLIGTISPVSA
jgi:hypothetical protein